MKLTDYITGNRRGKEARRLEREAMEDPLLADALDGYDSTPGNHAERIERLQRRVESASRRRIYRVRGSVAAALLLCMATGGYWLLRRGTEALTPPQLSLTEDAAVRTEAPVFPSDSVMPAMSDTEKLPGRTKEREVAKKTEKGTAAQALKEGAIVPPDPYPARDEVCRKREPAEAQFAADREPAVQAKSPAPTAQTEELFVTAEQETETVREPPEAGRTHRAEKASRGRAAGQAFGAAPNKSDPDRRAPLSGPVIDERRGAPAGTTVVSDFGGTSTDADGRFDRERLSASDTLCRSGIGFVSRDVPGDTACPQLVTLHGNRDTLRAPAVENAARPASGAAAGRGAPEPVGGQENYRRYLERENTYPIGSSELPHGQAELTFRIDRRGRPTSIRIVRSVGRMADAEAVRLVSEGPDWKPGHGEVRLSIDF